MTTEWHTYEQSIIIHKVDGSNLLVQIGEFITYKGREGGVRVDKFIGNSVGPWGMEYLPWRGARWATPEWSLRGNQRFIICLPYGVEKYGQHIDWNTVEHVNNGICPDLL